MPAKKTATAKKSAPINKSKYNPFTKNGILFNYNSTVGGIYTGYYKGNIINTLDKKMFLTSIITPTSGSTNVKKDIKSSNLILIKKKIDINTDFIKEYKNNGYKIKVKKTNNMPAKKKATKKKAVKSECAVKLGRKGGKAALAKKAGVHSPAYKAKVKKKAAAKKTPLKKKAAPKRKAAVKKKAAPKRKAAVKKNKI
jgi:hypothetical protein